VAADDALAEAARIGKVLAAMERLPKAGAGGAAALGDGGAEYGGDWAVLGKSESSVRSLLFRARAHLRERLRD
jgi:RNA polymerase sigma-70 factor (ECF subfamily)